ncbi:hypothetical protein OPIT5_00110 (plasmid) [Opitutaceae bacterium TAV5]|nr:hypothetical protein OPIT5_00110 [Opitutaceae bacterium TAV5]
MNANPRSKLFKLWIPFGILLLVAICFFAWHAFAPSLPPLPVETYVSRARGLAGNRYELRGRIERQLEAMPDGGRIILVRDLATHRALPFLDAGKSPGFYPEPGQLYALSVEVDTDGILNLTGFRKL